MDEHLIITFITAAGSLKRLRVAEPDPALTTSTIAGAVNLILSSNVFDVPGGSLTSAKKVELQKVTRTVLI